MNKRFVILGLFLCLSNCGTFEEWFIQKFLTKSQTIDIENSERKLSFSIPSNLDLEDFSKSLADYAAICWIADDPVYSLRFPSVRENGDMQLSLIATDNNEITEALRLIVHPVELKTHYEILAFGPLAHRQYEEPLLRGLHRAAIAKTDCE